MYRIQSECGNYDLNTALDQEKFMNYISSDCVLREGGVSAYYPSLILCFAPTFTPLF